MPQAGNRNTTYMSWLEDESPYDMFGMPSLPGESLHPNVNDSSGSGSDWNSFASHFTSEFESLKAEVDSLRSEVKQLKKVIKDVKVFICLLN